MAVNIPENFLNSSIHLLHYYKGLGERTMAQLSNEELHRELAAHSNSIVVIIKHLHGNMLSRWTNFLTEDGEKPWRKREEEFEDTLQDRQELMKLWEEAWQVTLSAVEALQTDDLNRTVYVRHVAHTVLEALQRQLLHTAYHIGQIVLLGKQLKGDAWQSLSIPRGGTDAYNQQMFARKKGQQSFHDGWTKAANDD